MNLLPFDLETALKHPERVVYRNGEKPLEWHYFKVLHKSFPIVTIHKNFGKASHLNNGVYGIPPLKSSLDLFLLPPTRKALLGECL